MKALVTDLVSSMERIVTWVDPFVVHKVVKVAEMIR